VLPIVGGRRSGLRVSSAKPGALDLLPTMRHAKEDPSSAVGCFALESPTLDLLDKDWPLGKKLLPRSNSKFEFSILRTWSKLVIGLKVALG
jgi:hypothetical protein